MIYKYYNSKIALVFVNLTFTILFLFFIMNQSAKPKSLGDDTFHLEAKAIAGFIKGFRSFEDVQLTKAPGPSLFYSVPYILVAADSEDAKFWFSAFIWNLILVFLCTSLVLVTIFKHINRLVSWVTLLLLFAIPLHLYYSFGVLAEPLAFSGICIFLAGSIPLVKSEKFKIINVLFIVMGLIMFLTARPNGVLVFVLFPLFLLILLYIFKVPLLKMKGFILGFILALFGIILLSFTVKSLPGNQKQELQENYLLFVMHHGRFQYRTEYFDWRFWDSDTRMDSKDYQNWIKSVVELGKKADQEGRTLNNIYAEWLIKDAQKNPGNIVIQAIIRLFSGNYLQVNSVEVGKQSLLGLAFFLVNLLNILINMLAVFGFIQLFKKNRQWLFIIVPVIALLAFHMFIYMEQRYLYPYRLIIIFLAANYVIDYFSKINYIKKITAKWHI